MNAPERHRSYQLDEGQARMTYEPDQRVASDLCGTFSDRNRQASRTIQHEHAVKF